MGRVSKYKKIKSCDPYSKQNKKHGINLETVGVWGLGDDGRRKKKRSRTAEKLKQKTSKKAKKNSQDDGFFDVPCEKDEFDLNDLMGSVKKQVPQTLQETDKITTVKSNQHDEASYHQVITSTGNVANIPKSLEDETKVAKLLKLDQQVDANNKEQAAHKMQRQEGESKNAYRKRTKAETRQIIQKTSVTKRKTAKLEKKKEFLKQKKIKKKGKGLFVNDDDDDEYDSDVPPIKGDSSGGLLTGERAVAAMAAARDEPRFGEQAERPPIFRQLPRGAQKGKQTTDKTGHKTMSMQQIEAEQNAMERMRRKVQAQYAAIRAKRRQDGNGFHL
jgi:hypothetical protein